MSDVIASMSSIFGPTRRKSTDVADGAWVLRYFSVVKFALVSAVPPMLRDASSVVSWVFRTVACDEDDETKGGS